MMEKNILYISYDGMTDPLGQSQVIPYLKGLSKEGFKINILSFEKTERFKKYKSLIAEELKNSSIDWYPMKYTRRPLVFSTLHDIRKMICKSVSIVKEKNISLLHCRSYIAAIAGLRIKKKYEIPFIFDMRGFWADERIDGGLWKLSNPIYRIIYKYFKKKEIELIKRSDFIVSLTAKAKEIILGFKNITIKPEKISIIPCCADLEHFNYEKCENSIVKFRDKVGIGAEKFVVSYLGSTGTWYMLDEMIEQFKMFKIRIPNSVFLIITQDDKNIILKRLIFHGLKSDDVIIREASRNEVPEFLSLSNVSLSFIKPCFSKNASSATKMGEIMGMGIPVICNAIGDIKTIVEITNCGYCLDNYSEEEYEKACDYIISKKFPAKNEIREAARKYYSLESGIERYKKIYGKNL